MAKKVELKLTDEQFAALHEAADSVRSDAKAAKVDLTALRTLLLDHAALISLHKADIGGFL
jgi:hypothetical protein